MRNNMVQIDVAAIKQAIKNTRMTSSGLSKKIGRSSSYIGNCFDRGIMSRYALELLSDILHVDVASLMNVCNENGAKREGYSVNLDVKPEKVRLQILFNGEVVGSAYSKVKGQNETDLMQAISYAAHMIYKISEQKRLECE